MGGDIYCNLRGRGPPNLTPERQSLAASVTGSRREDSLTPRRSIGGPRSRIRINRQPSESPKSSGTATKSFGAQGRTDDLGVADDGKTFAAVAHSWTPRLKSGPVHRRLETDHARNESLKAGWGEAEKLHWKNDGCDVQGWLMYPEDYRSRRRNIRWSSGVHGGPARGQEAGWPSADFDLSALSGRAISSSIRTRAAASARAKPSRGPT